MNIFSLAAAAASVCCLSAFAGEGSLKSGIDKSNFDPSMKPQDDLFRHVNGKWLNEANIPSDRPAQGAFFELRDLSEERTKAIIEEAAKKKAMPMRRRSPTSMRRSWTKPRPRNSA